MNAQAASLAGGFRSPVFDSQHAFRGAMEALSRPGLIHPVGQGLENTPVPPAAAALVLALCDYTTSLYLAPSIAQRRDVVDYLRFYTDCIIDQDASQAAFALIDLAADGLDLSHFAQGTAEYPDRSTTLIVTTSSLEAGLPLRLQGPGIAGQAELRIAGLPAGFARQWHANRAQFPLGVDILFADAASIVGLPRSTRISGENG